MPKRYLLLALNGPTTGDGDEQAYNRWYDETHLPAFKTIEGILSARRYKVLRGKLPGMEAWPYLAVYEIETDDLSAVSARLGQEFQTFPPTLDRTRSAHLMAIQIGGDDFDP